MKNKRLLPECILTMQGWQKLSREERRVECLYWLSMFGEDMPAQIFDRIAQIMRSFLSVKFNDDLERQERRAEFKLLKGGKIGRRRKVAKVADNYELSVVSST